MTSAAKERAERLAVHRGGGPDDPHPRKSKGATYRDFAAAEFSGHGGRFSAQSKSQVIGTEPVSYPRLPEASPWHDNVVPPEEPLGVDINAVEPTGTFAEIQKSIEATDASPPSSAAPVGGAGASPGPAPAKRAPRRLKD
jgi:hypothetical protein